MLHGEAPRADLHAQAVPLIEGEPLSQCAWNPALLKPCCLSTLSDLLHCQAQLKQPKRCRQRICKALQCSGHTIVLQRSWRVVLQPALRMDRLALARHIRWAGQSALSFTVIFIISDPAARLGVAAGHASVQLPLTGTDWAAHAMLYCCMPCGLHAFGAPSAQAITALVCCHAPTDLKIVC